MEQKGFSVKDTASALISDAKTYDSLVFRNDANAPALYSNLKTNLQELKRLQDSVCPAKFDASSVLILRNFHRTQPQDSAKGSCFPFWYLFLWKTLSL